MTTPFQAALKLAELSGPSSMPTISVAGFTRDLTARALESMAVQHASVPLVFQRGGVLVRVLDAEDGLRAEPFALDSLRGHLDRVANWVKLTQEVEKPSSPPPAVVKDLLGLPTLPETIPILRGIVHAPVVLSGGRILDQAGYDSQSGLLLDLGDLTGKVRHDMPLAAARDLLTVELLGDFPFADDGSLAHALALLLLPFVRHMIGGLLPLTLIEAPSPGTGKGLLAEMLTYPFHGKQCAVMLQPGNSDESRKAITSALIQGEAFIFLDNVKHLKGEALSAALTAEVWIDRILGKSRLVRLRNDAVWLATGNNVALSPEQARRTVLVRLDARIERPEYRSVWRHQLPLWARENRAELVSAALSLVTHWVASGMPRSTTPLGRFEEWAAIMGGILETAGVRGFLTGRERLHTASDTETSEWTAFCFAWWEVHHSNAATAKDLLKVAQQADLLLDVRAGHSLLASQQRLGHALRARRDRVFGRFVIRHVGSDSGTGNAAYSLEATKTPETPDSPPERGDEAAPGTSVLAGVSENVPQDTGISNGGNSTFPDVSGVSGVSSLDRDDEWSEV